jgi:hypothetical protein
LPAKRKDPGRDPKPGHLAAGEQRHWGHTSDHVRGAIVAQISTDTSMVGTTSARECDGERKLGMYSFRTIEGATCTVVVFSLLVGARRRSAVRGGAERSGETARPKDFEEQSELEALSV